MKQEVINNSITKFKVLDSLAVKRKLVKMRKGFSRY
jgi:hypothetical protein